MKIKEKTKKGTKLIAVLKADAYGCGIIQCAFALKAIADCFAVATLDEAIKLKNFDSNLEVMLLSPILGLDILIAIENDIIITVFDVSTIKTIDFYSRKSKKFAKVFVKIDSGMNRLGVKSFTEFHEIIDCLKCTGITIKGFFSHFYNAEDFVLDKLQYEVFNGYLNEFCEDKKKSVSLLNHISSSLGVFCDKKFNIDAVRCGIALFGISGKFNANLENTVKLYAPVVAKKSIEKGEYVGYSMNFLAKYDMEIAVIRAGYADFVPRALSNLGYFNINGKRCKIVGNVCMDLTMVDITDAICKVGDVAYFVEDIEDLKKQSDLANTIPYELLTNVNCRVVRNYVL